MISEPAPSESKQSISKKAVASFILAILSFLFLFLTSIPALILGKLALGEIYASEKKLKGKRLAVLSIYLCYYIHIFSVLLFIAGILYCLADGVRTVAVIAQRTNTVRNFGISAMQHDAAKGYLLGTAEQPQFPPEDRLSSITLLLPFMERMDLYNQIDFEKTWHDPQQSKVINVVLRDLIIPGGPRGKPITTIVGNAGVGRNAAYLSPDDPDAGIFLYNAKTTLSSVSQADGTAFTILALDTETDLGRWAAGGRPTVRGFEPDKIFTRGKWDFFRTNHQFGGFIPGNALVVFADQHTKTLYNDIDPKVLQTLFTKNGGEPVDEDIFR
ncbi:Hypothetical protein PBC10988_9260 [Planctomycetales bacterium 10988]|nr:Hypothetical protein PBC10988_9260 [Planctomycetales bacterium 10988]